MSCGSVPTRFSPYYRHISATRPQQTVHLRHVRFSQANTQLPSASWARIANGAVPSAPARVRTHRPTWTIGTRHCAAQVTSACSYKCVPECDRLSAHRTREGPGGIRRYARAQAAAGELWLHDNGASNTSMPIATTTCAARCSLALQPVPARLARPDCVSEACSGSLR